MDIPIHVWLFAAIAFGILILLFLVAWARRGRVFRWGAILLGLAVIGASYPVLAGLLSRPKDQAEEWFHRDAKEALVSGVYVDEGVALYLYLMIPGVTEPRSYRFAWSDETRKLAESVQGALESEEGQAGGVIIDLPFQPSLEREKPLTAHPVPQIMPPPKKQPRAPMEFKGGSGAV